MGALDFLTKRDTKDSLLYWNVGIMEYWVLGKWEIGLMVKIPLDREVYEVNKRVTSF